LAPSLASEMSWVATEVVTAEMVMSEAEAIRGTEEASGFLCALLPHGLKSVSTLVVGC